jgi:hypothetical protein
MRRKRYELITMFVSIIFLFSCSSITSLFTIPTLTPESNLTPKISFTTAKIISETDLIGSIWEMIDGPSSSSPEEYTIQFEVNGKLTVNYYNDHTPLNDSWSMNGNQIKLFYNDKYVTCTGEIIDYNTMKGSAININNYSWDWVARRK